MEADSVHVELARNIAFAKQLQQRLTEEMSHFDFLVNQSADAIAESRELLKRCDDGGGSAVEHRERIKTDKG